VSRLPIRARLTAAFAVAMVLVLVGAGSFVYLRLKSDLNESLSAGLVARASAVLAAGSASAGAAGDREEGFAQLLGADGSTLDSTGGIRGQALGRAELRRAAAGEEILVERTVPASKGPRGFSPGPAAARRWWRSASHWTIATRRWAISWRRSRSAVRSP